MGSTKIQWTNQTWNPVTGCSSVSTGCKNCYARRMAKRLRGRFGYPEDDPFKVTLHPDRLEEPLRWRKPRMVFVCSMGDLFHEDVPDEFIVEIFGVMAVASDTYHMPSDGYRFCGEYRFPNYKHGPHDFQVLTKRPLFATRFLNRNMERVARAACRFAHDKTPASQLYDKVIQSWPLSNVWLGTSVENEVVAYPRIEALQMCPAAVRFLSIEPLLEPIDPLPLDLIDWVIVGGETGPGARPMNPDWAREIRDQCKAAGVPFFMKQMSKKAPIPKDLQIREWPKVR